MKIIKKGNPYRKHKCSICKTIFAYHIHKDVCVGNLLYCPVCRNCYDFNISEDMTATIKDKSGTYKEVIEKIVKLKN